MKFGFAVSALFLVAGCNKHPPATTEEAGVSATSADVAVRAEAGDSPQRCNVVVKASLAESGAGEGFDFGDGVAVQGGAIVGLLRSVQGVRRASIARVSPDLPARVVDLGVPLGDDPPPKPFVRGAEAFAAAYVEEPRDGEARAPGKRPGSRARRLIVYRVTDSPEPLVTVEEGNDESPAFDAVALSEGSSAGALVVWDEDAAPSDGGEEAPRGVIRAALLAPDLRSVVQVATVSPELTDAERPKVLLKSGGFWVAWIAKRREPQRDAGPELEAPGEDQAYRWVELLALDEHGRPVGAVRRLSSGSGHVAGFDMRSGGSRLDATIILDDENGEAAGGEILHVVAPAEGPPRVAPIRGAGAGRGTAPWLSWAAGSRGWLAYVDTSDRTRLVPLDADGASAGADSLEPALDDARPLLAGAFGASGILAVSPGSKGGLRWLSCGGAR